MDDKRKPDHPLPKPKFSDRERAAYDWLYNRDIRGWVADLVSKEVKYVNRPYGFKSLIEFAQHHGWEG